MAKRVFLVLFLPVLLSSLLVADETTDLNSVDSSTSASVSKELTMNTDRIDYFEIGFLSSPYAGTGAPAISSSTVELDLHDDGYASGSIYVFWSYATDDKFRIELSITDLAFENQDSIKWNVSALDNEINVVPSGKPYAWSFNEDSRFSSGLEKGVLLNLETTETVFDKLVGVYEGSITLTITSDGETS